MKRRTFARNLIGTTVMFLVLIAVCVIIVLLEHYLENFNSH